MTEVIEPLTDWQSRLEKLLTEISEVAEHLRISTNDLADFNVATALTKAVDEELL